MKIGISGANGYVGSHLARRLQEKGHAISRLSRSRGFFLGEPVEPEIVAGLDVLIHAAYDFTVRGSADIERVNVSGSVALFEAAVASDVRRLIFISSMAAFPGCRSSYGQGKLAVETQVLRLGGTVVRPGTIYGGEGGGIFRSVTALAEKLPVIPLPGAGNQRLYLIHIDDLAMLIGRLVDVDLAEETRLLRIASAEPLTLRSILTRVAESLGRRRVFLPLPEGLIMVGLRTAEAILGSKCPVRSDSLLSLLNPDPAPDFSLPESLVGGLELRKFEVAAGR